MQRASPACASLLTQSKEVRQTRIFVAPTADGRQVTIYENYVGITPGGGKAEKRAALEAKQKAERESRNAMILPCPLKEGGKGVRTSSSSSCSAHHCDSYEAPLLTCSVAQMTLLDLSKDTFSFAWLDCCFPYITETTEKKEARSRKPQKDSRLKVHEVGAYKMSIASTLEDLRRIDESVFVVPPNIEQLMAAHYAKVS